MVDILIGERNIRSSLNIENYSSRITNRLIGDNGNYATFARGGGEDRFEKEGGTSLLTRTGSPHFLCTRLPEHWRANKSLPEQFKVIPLGHVEEGTRVKVMAGNSENATAELRNNCGTVADGTCGFADLRFVGKSGRGRYFHVVITVESNPRQVAVYEDAIKVTTDGPRIPRNFKHKSHLGNLQKRQSSNLHVATEKREDQPKEKLRLNTTDLNQLLFSSQHALISKPVLNYTDENVASLKQEGYSSLKDVLFNNISSPQTNASRKCLDTGEKGILTDSKISQNQKLPDILKDNVTSYGIDTEYKEDESCFCKQNDLRSMKPLIGLRRSYTGDGTMSSIGRSYVLKHIALLRNKILY